MKIANFIFILLLLLGGKLFGQCPPVGFPNSGNTCPQAPILCENLDGYCNTINNNNTPQSYPGCPGWQLNNDEWFGFYAGTTTITIQVTPTNCTSTGSNQGMQAAIYSGCGPPWNVVDAQCACTENPFVLSATNFIVGNIYWFVLDGCGGDVCDYSIDVLEGSTVGQPPPNPGPISGDAVVCAGAAENYTLTAVQGATIYNWSVTPSNMGSINGNQNNSTVTWGNTTGTAQVCVTVANACYPNPTPSCYTVEIDPKPTATLSGTGVLCAGTSGTVPLTVTFTGEAPWTFVYTIGGVPQAPITTSSNPYTINATQPGAYALLSVGGGTVNCVGTVSGTSNITLITINTSVTTTPSFCGNTAGGIDLSVSGGTAPYTYNWSSGQTTQDLAGITGGSYTVTVTDANGCTKVQNATVTNNTVNPNVTGTTVANTTCNGGNGSIDASVTPSGTYTYLWSNGATTEDLSGLTPGTYTLTVTAGVNCTGTASFTIANQPNEPNLSATTVNTTCDLLNGSINLTITGGVAPYSILWSNGATGTSLTNILAGPYSVTVTGANGCTKALDINITNTNPPFSITGTVVANTSCNGGNGSITTSVSPANTYTYLWSNGATTPNLTNLDPGTYDLTVSAGGSCTSTASFTVPNNPNLPVITPTVVQSTCDLANGSISIVISGGVSPYSILWSNGATTNSITNILAGSYSVTVTGANGCTQTADITLGNNNPPINISGTVVANTNCNGIGNGSISVTVTPAGTYTYLWSTGATSLSLANLLPGTYDITVSAGGSCTQSASFTVPDDPNEPQINPTTIQSTCDLSNGSITLNVSGGVTPYTFLWSTGATSSGLTNIPAGSYDVTVTGANGCSSTANINLANNNPPININGTVVDNTTCIGGNGSISTTVTPAGTYTYLWSTGATSTGLSNLLPGTYDLTVSAGGSCTQTASFTIDNDPNAPDLSFAAVQPSCGLSNGSINLTVSGGVAPYTYSWSSGQTTQDLNNIPDDIYIVTVTGANGCTAVDGYVLDEAIVNITIDPTVTPHTSCVTNNGAISLALTPANMTVTWSTGATTANLNNIPPGVYDVTVSAGGTCTETATIVVPDDSEIPYVEPDITNAACGLANGAIDLTIFSGLPPFTYHWSNNATTPSLSNLPTGSYAVTITSSVGCTSIVFAGVPNDDIDIEIFGYQDNNTSCTQPNGSVFTDIFPPGYTYLYHWSNGSTSPNLQNLSAGEYTVTVTLGSTCSESIYFEIVDIPVLPVLSVFPAPASCNVANGAINLTVTSGEGPFTYHWSNNAATEDLNNVAPGTYSVTVTGTNNCTATASGIVQNNNVAVNITGTAAQNTSCISNNGSININVSPAGVYTYVWSNGLTSQNLSNLAAGTYTVTATLGSCSGTASFTVTNNTPNPDISALVTPSICGASNGAIDLSIGGNIGPYIYSWSNSTNNEDLSNILSGTYSVTVVAANGCQSDTIFNVANNAATFSISGTASPLTNCAQNNGAVDLVITPPGVYTIVWSTAATTEDLSGLPAGSYTVSVTESGSCTATASFIVDNNQVFPNASTSVVAEICDLVNGSIDLNPTGGVLPYSFLWSNGFVTEDLNNVAAGTYSVLVTGANGCTVTTGATIPGNSIGFAVNGTPAANTSCIANNGSISIDVLPASPGNGLSYSYQWEHGPITDDLAALPAGTYTITVSAGGSCTNVATFTIDNTIPDPVVTKAITPAFCGQSSGEIDISVNNGIAPYTYVWSNAALTEDITGMPAGTYTVTVTGANGCTATNTGTIPDNSITPSINGQTGDNTACVGANGSISLTVSPALNYTFNWSGGQNVQDLQGLPTGTYTVTVNGGGACISSATFTVPNNTAVIDLNGNLTNILCFGGNNGAIVLAVANGTGPFNYNWAPVQSGNPQDLSGLNAGNYGVTVTDALGCTASSAFTLTQPASSVQVSCSATALVGSPGAADGAGAVNISGGVAPYSVDWSPGGSQNFVSAGNFPINSLTVGNYLVTVTDANGCSSACNFNVNLIDCHTALGAMSGNQILYCGAGCITAGYNNLGQFLEPGDVLQFILHEGAGNQIVNEIARSSQPTFCFNPALMNYGTTYYISAAAGDNDGSGNVSLSAYCTVITAGTPIVFREKPVTTAAVSGPINCVTTVVTLSGTSDLPGAVFQWNTNTGHIVGSATQAVITADKAGAYRLVIDVNGCLDTTSVNVVNITNNPVAKILASPDDILDCVIDEIILSGTIEGSLNANAIWFNNGNVYSNGNPVQINTPGTYEFVILDTLSFCTDTATITIAENQSYPSLFIDPPGQLTCQNNTILLTGGSPFSGIVLNWATVNGTDTTIVGAGNSLNVTAPGIYFLIGNDPVNHCTNAITTTVTADQNYPYADAGPSFSIDCFGETGFLDGSGSGGAAVLNYLWTTTDGNISGSNTVVSPQIDEPGTYRLLVVNPANGCAASDEVVISPKVPLITTKIKQPPCYGEKGTILIDSILGGKPPFLYSMNDGPMSPQNNFTNLAPGLYNFEILDANGCTATISATLTEPVEIELFLDPQYNIELGDEFKINTQINIPESNIASIKWTPGDWLDCDTCLQPTTTPLNSIHYKVTVIDSAGCRAAAPTLIVVDKDPDIFVPNIFSPDGDGNNDVFLIFANKKSIEIITSFHIFNRWGEHVFEAYDFQPNDPVHGWDGKFRGQDLNPAVFVWYANIRFIDGREVLLEGDVTLER